MAAHESAGALATLLSAEVDNPTGLGRIIRDRDGRLAQIVEDRDATGPQLAIREINAGGYVFDAAALRAGLARIGRDNAQGEEYLTDVPGLLAADGGLVAVHRMADPVEASAATTAGAGRGHRPDAATDCHRLDAAGDGGRPGQHLIDVTVPWNPTWCSNRIPTCGADHGRPGARRRPEVTLIDTAVGAGARVVRAHAEQAVIGPEAQVGPYAYLRPGARLARGAKVGTFVEVKNSTVGEAAKVPHLTYVGDATIGAGANIGAGTIFVNYDGVTKHHTEVGRAAFVGSNSSLIAPVTIGDGAYVAAGSAVAEDVPPGALGIARGTQRNVDGWVLRKRAGTPSAAVAEQAQAAEEAAG